jgi:hypothetical protein
MNPLENNPEAVENLWMKLKYRGTDLGYGRQIVLTYEECDYLASLIPEDHM